MGVVTENYRNGITLAGKENGIMIPQEPAIQPHIQPNGVERLLLNMFELVRTPIPSSITSTSQLQNWLQMLIQNWFQMLTGKEQNDTKYTSTYTTRMTLNEIFPENYIDPNTVRLKFKEWPSGFPSQKNLYEIATYNYVNGKHIITINIPTNLSTTIPPWV